jgi:mRNA interferase RelE/StbE
VKGELSGLRRLRVGHHRIVYEVIESRVTILVVRIAHRREVYR